MFEPNHFDIESILKERIDLTNRERQIIKEKYLTVDTKYKSILSQLNGVNRPKETLDEINKKITELEYSHTTTSQTNYQEKEFMRNLTALKQKKKSLIQYLQIQNEFEDIKNKKTSLQSELKEKDDLLEELNLGIRRCRTAISLNCAVSDIISDNLIIPEDKLSKVIGKGGSSLKQIESDHKVSLEISKLNNQLTVLGSAESIASAKSAINQIINTSSDDFELSESTIAVLIIDKGTLAQDIQNRHNIRIDINKAKKTCKLIGLIENLPTAKHEILSLKTVKKVVSFESSAVPFIMGKNGLTIRSIGDDHHVLIEVNKEKLQLSVLGFEDGVKQAVDSILNIISENKEVEEILKIEKQVMIGCVIGSNGSNIRNIQSMFNVNMRTEKGGTKDKDKSANSSTSASAKETKSKNITSHNDIDNLYITGTASRVLAAKNYLTSLIATYSANSETLLVDNEIMPIILGKKGSRINQLRLEHPLVNIDVDDNTIRVCGGSAENRAAARASLDEIINQNLMKTIVCENDIGILLKSPKGLDIRQELLTNLSLNVDIDTENNIIKLRGKQENLNKGIELINDFISNYQILIIDLTEEDCSSLMNIATSTSTSKDPSDFILYPTKYMELSYGVEVFVNRKENKLRIRGSDSQIKQANNYLKNVLSGNPEYNAIYLSINPIFYATIIGKAGANLRKIENDFNVKVDILKSRSLIRIRGLSKSINDTKSYLIDFMDSVRTTVTLDLPEDIPASVDISSCIDKIRYLLDVEITLTEKTFTIKGPLVIAEESKKLLNELLVGKVTFSLKINVPFIFTNKIKKLFNYLKDNYHIDYNIDFNDSPELNTSHTINMSGSFDKITQAKQELNKILISYLPKSNISIITTFTSFQLKKLFLQKTLIEIFEKFNTSTSDPCIYQANSLSIQIDRLTNTLYVFTTNLSIMNELISYINEKLVYYELNYLSIPIDRLAIPLLVGKNGLTISNLEKQIGNVTISINRNMNTIEVEVSSNERDNTESILSSAKEILTNYLNKIKSEYYEEIIDETMMRVLIGKQQATINKFRSELQANIELDFNTRLLRLTGTSEQVAQAKTSIFEYLASEGSKNYSETIFIPFSAIPKLIGVKGSNIKDLQESLSVKVDLNKDIEKGVIRGSPEAVALAKAKIKELLEADGYHISTYEDKQPIVKEVEVEVEEEIEVANTSNNLPKKNISKSAQRRLRKKEKQSQVVSESSTNIATTELVANVEVIAPVEIKPQVIKKPEKKTIDDILNQPDNNELTNLITNYLSNLSINKKVDINIVEPRNNQTKEILNNITNQKFDTVFDVKKEPFIDLSVSVSNDLSHDLAVVNNVPLHSNNNIGNNLSNDLSNILSTNQPNNHLNNNPLLYQTNNQTSYTNNNLSNFQNNNLLSLNLSNDVNQESKLVNQSKYLNELNSNNKQSMYSSNYPPGYQTNYESNNYSNNQTAYLNNYVNTHPTNYLSNNLPNNQSNYLPNYPTNYQPNYSNNYSYKSDYLDKNLSTPPPPGINNYNPNQLQNHLSNNLNNLSGYQTNYQSNYLSNDQRNYSINSNKTPINQSNNLPPNYQYNSSINPSLNNNYYRSKSGYTVRLDKQT